jgi:thiol-disulfide isomerase/thioredoxin
MSILLWGALIASQLLPTDVDAASLRQLLRRHAGKPVLINVLASWCGPCRAELPALARLKRQHPSLVLIGLDVDSDDDALLAFLPQIPGGFSLVRSRDGLKRLLPALSLPDDWNQAMPEGWEGNVPLTFLFDRKAKFANGSVGELSPSALSAFAKSLP